MQAKVFVQNFHFLYPLLGVVEGLSGVFLGVKITSTKNMQSAIIG